LVRIYKAQAEDKGLSFRCQIINTLPQRIRADEKRVGQILINILSNAVKFTQTGEIVFSISYSGGVAKFQITDTGEGIHEQQLQDIFQPFTRLQNVTGNAVSGSGLGLTISKILAEIMGGELTVISKPGQGSTFTVRLFLANLGASPDLCEIENIAGYRGRRQKILVVDDQPEHRDLMISILEPLGFIVTEADSGEDCLLKVAKIRPNLILLDLAMSGIDGSETAIQLRKKGLMMPIIILSANAYPSDRLNAMNAGCNDFLAKPIQVQHLLNKLKLHLALNWLCQSEDIDLPGTSPEEPFLIPPADIIEKFVHFVRIGDLLGLNKHLDKLAKNQPEYYPFASRIKVLAGEFRIAEIKKLLV